MLFRSWTSAETWDELAEKMSIALQDVPGVTYGFQYPVAMRFNELMTGAKQDVVCKIFGENLDTLSKYSKILGEISTKIDGAEAVYVEPIDGLPQVKINYKRNLISQYGLNIADINRVINTAFAGQSSGQVFEDERRFDLVVRLAGEKRKDLEDIQNLLIPTPKGAQIPLYQVADVSIQESVNQIQREDAKRRIIVGFNIHDRDVQSIVKDLQKAVEKNLKLPSGYFITYGGAFENLEAAKKRLMIAVPLSLLLILLFLYFAFGSIKQGLLIYSAIPLSAIGGILFLFMRGMPFSISAGIGFIALFGVAVLNGIVLISEFNRIKAEGATDTTQIVLQGTKHRLRPVLMTAFVASLGFLPMALSQGAGAEVQRPLATVVIGGLLIATFLTLFLLPVLYILFENGLSKKKFKNILNSIVLIGVILIINLQTTTAQTPINLQDAIQIAMKNNLQLKNEILNAEYQKKLKIASVDIPKTNLTGEYGQINSLNKDFKFGISQSICFPTIYSTQKSLQNAIYKSSLLNVDLKGAELVKKVSEVFYLILYMQQKQSILLQNDSIFAEFLFRANIRFIQGESNILEKTTAESQRGQVLVQLNQLKNDMEILQLQFSLLLNTSTVYIPTAENPKMIYNAILDTATIKNHLQIKLLQQEIETATFVKKLERNKLLPDLNFGFNTMSIKGSNPENIEYSKNYQFHSVQFGISFPLIYFSQKAKINAAQIQLQISQNNFLSGIESYNFQYVSAFMKYRTNIETVKYFENTGLKIAETITSTANQQYINGDINFLEWTILINNANSIKSDYIDSIKELNQIIIQLNFLSTK